MKKFFIALGLFLFLANVVSGQEFNTWKTIEVGKYSTFEKFWAEFIKPETKYTIYQYGISILEDQNFSGGTQTINFVKVSPEELGLKKNWDYEQVIEVAEKAGLKKCELTDAIYVREIYPEQSTEERLIVGAVPYEHMGDFHSLALFINNAKKPTISGEEINNEDEQRELKKIWQYAFVFRK